MSSLDLKRLKRTMLIYRVVQILLVALLVFVAFQFQTNFAQLGTPQRFTSAVVTSLVIQLIMFYPIYLLARRDTEIELSSSAVGLTPEQLAALRKKRLLGDLWKFCAVAFFLAFVTLSPDATKAVGASHLLAITIFSFLIMCLTYFQCFNYTTKKRLKSL